MRPRVQGMVASVSTSTLGGAETQLPSHHVAEPGALTDSDGFDQEFGHIRELIFPDVDLPHLQPLIQGLSGQLNGTVSKPGALCTNLSRIYFEDIDRNHGDDHLELISKPLLTLLNNNLRLTHLHVFAEITSVEGFTAALPKLRHLQHLTIDADFECFYIEEPLLFLRSCLALTELTGLHFVNDAEMYWDDGDERAVRRQLEAVIQDASVARFSQSTTAKKIKQLTLPSNRQGSSNPLPLLLFKSNLLDLKKLEIPGFGPDASIHEIEQVVREHCSGLKHLECSHIDEENGLAVRAFVRGCSGLQSFTSPPPDDSDAEPLWILSELVSSHHTTLEVIDIESQRVLSHQLQEVLASCKQLKRLWVKYYVYRGVHSISYRHMAKSDWVCTELRELSLVVDRCRPEEDAFDEQDEDDEGGLDDAHVCSETCTCAPKRAFQQIGRLEKLEMLEIDIDQIYRARATADDYAWDLTLSKGWLGELAGLKSLKSFVIREEFTRAMGLEEMKFMHEHWPLLNEVIIWCQSLDSKAEPHWQWLLDRRPQLLFARREY
ncbi:unnamed protein product [Mortierella alpina]